MQAQEAELTEEELQRVRAFVSGDGLGLLKAVAFNGDRTAMELLEVVEKIEAEERGRA